MLNNNIKEKISMEVIKTLVSRFENFPANAHGNRNAPFHEAFLKAFANELKGKVPDVPYFISLSSWLHGLNTTLGQSFFENIAHILCNGEKREYTSKRLGNLKITQKQRNNIENIINNLTNSNTLPDLDKENNLIFQNDNTNLIDAYDFSADVFFETNTDIVAIELKTVKPNSGGMQGEKRKILEGKAALFHSYPNKNIHFFFGFPFDPTVDPAKENCVSYNKQRFLRSIINATKFCAINEFLIASELWDYLSNTQDTMTEILNIINKIATPMFQDKIKLLRDNSKRTTKEYLQLLIEWNLFSEKELIENNSIIYGKIIQDNDLSKVYNKITFDNNGKYNWERYDKLKKLL